MFKRKKRAPQTGAKYFKNNINTLELVTNSGNEMFLRPAVVEKTFDNVEEAENFLSALRLMEGTSSTDVYANGIKIEQVSLDFINKKFKLVTGKFNSEQTTVDAAVLEKLADVHLTDSEKAELCASYGDNPNVVVFYNYKTELKDKQLEKLKDQLLSLFCDAIVMFITTK